MKKDVKIPGSEIVIRHATPRDCEQVYKVHITSIRHFCSDYYSTEVVLAWISSKSLDAYRNLPNNIISIIAENDGIIFGFGFLNLKNRSIDSLYLLPHRERKGYGKAILFRLEEIARNAEIRELG